MAQMIREEELNTNDAKYQNEIDSKWLPSPAEFEECVKLGLDDPRRIEVLSDMDEYYAFYISYVKEGQLIYVRLGLRPWLLGAITDVFERMVNEGRLSPLHWTEAGLTKSQADAFVSGLVALVKPTKTHYLWRPLLRDPNDEMVLEVAVNGKADAIITFNFRDYGDIPEKFGIELLKSADALRRLRK